MERPCYIVVDRDFPGSISSRKLVIETAKFNVITAYDGSEAIDCLKRFPKVDGVVINADMGSDEECRKLIRDLRTIVPKLDVIVISAGDISATIAPSTPWTASTLRSCWIVCSRSEKMQLLKSWNASRRWQVSKRRRDRDYVLMSAPAFRAKASGDDGAHGQKRFGSVSRSTFSSPKRR